MSTFFGGEQLVQTQVLMGSSTTSPETIYTVNSGEYCVVTIERLNSTGNTSIIVGDTESNIILTQAFVYTFSSGTVRGHVSTSGETWQPLHITAGEKIFIVGNNTTYRIIVKRYKQP